MKLPLFVTTASYLFFLICLAFPPALGSDYTGRMSATIGVNFGAALVMLVLSLVRKSHLRWTVAIASVTLALIWLIVGAVSSAV
jgi:hypothetical protein